MLASVYTDDLERGNAMGIALGGLALGVLSKESSFPAGFAPTASPELRWPSPPERGDMVTGRHGHVVTLPFPLQSGLPLGA